MKGDTRSLDYGSDDFWRISSVASELSLPPEMPLNLDPDSYWRLVGIKGLGTQTGPEF